ncbi:ribosomal-processing cysteine protease Prp [Peptoniphilaceae bacterium SGI.131]
MIEALIKKRDGKIVGYTISGHANYAEYNSDIVCSAVSILTYNNIDTFTDILRLREKINFRIDEKKRGFISFDLSLEDLSQREVEDTQLILNSFELGLKSLSIHYSAYILLDYREV